MMSKTNNFVFKGLHIMAWVIFVGLSIEAGAFLVNFIFSIYNPEFVGNLYQKLDLTQIYNSNKLVFYNMYGFILVISFLKAHLFYRVIILLSKLNLSNPFNTFVSDRITKISYYTFYIGLLSCIALEINAKLENNNYNTSVLNGFWSDGQAFIMMAAVIYIIATIFKKGVEIQAENDLTI